MRARSVAADEVGSDHGTASNVPGHQPRHRSDRQRERRKQDRRKSKTNIARAGRHNNGYKLAIDRKEALLREPGWRTLRQIFRRINETGPGMRQLHRLRTGDEWGYVGQFLRAFDAYDICTTQEVTIRGINYGMFLDAVRRHEDGRGGHASPSAVPLAKEPSYVEAPLLHSDDEDDGGVSSTCSGFDES